MIAKFRNYIKEVQAEMQKVAWSNRQELMASTVVVIISVGILAVFIGLSDFVLARLINVLIR